jgi:anthranilate synthase component 2
MKILVLDNYDSFTYNLVHLLRDLGTQPQVFRNDKIALEAVADYDKILLSPGPSLPAEAGIMPALLQKYASQKSILGVCLGHQAIGEAFGAKLYNLPEVVHGLATELLVKEAAEPLFRGLPEHFRVGRYHSWVVARESLADTPLRITAEDAQGQVMALRHRQYDVCGLQFHPESILTEHGKQMLANWLALHI